MKTSTIVAMLIVIIAVAIVGYIVFRPKEIAAPTVSPTPQFQEVQGSPGLSNLGQFVQLEPEATSPGRTSDETTLTAPAVTPDAANNTANEVTISVDETGFQPATVTITAGTTVTFVNNGQASHWPASDNHPTHDILPEFDAGKGLATGETYSHTFTKAGVWSMHDHLVPKNTGTITVTE